ncbi:MAG: bifunctional DNA-formamidopyrimidine glycosylase/DNA-(apurinic or apyrimidinic site) lyase [Desulfovibrio sp.]|nr:bifunctional DNA-formamidopyrimidine glycosylase/DNA-(apurinic or apyrimidinic site) lyase [Desulfovibrio sp.]
MPELPEVESVVRSLMPHVLGAHVTDVELIRRESLQKDSLPLSQLLGLRIVQILRRGKLILFGLEEHTAEKRFLVVHLRMTGALLCHPAMTPKGSHTRCIFHLKKEDTSLSLFFDDIRCFGTLFLATEAMLKSWKFYAELGPEPLETPLALFLARVEQRKSATIKAALLDQKVLAGLGNIYVDESLFLASIHPERTVASLSRDEKKLLLTSIKRILKKAIKGCGTSFRNYQDANGQAGAFQNELAVYGRDKKPCIRCKTPLQKIRVCGRGTVFCPRCQH